METLECKSIVRVLLPAVRVSMAEAMHTDFGYNQEQIAAKLGVVQVAVSKYLRGRYSKRIASAKRYIAKHRLADAIIKGIASGYSRQQTDKAIDELCERLVSYSAF